MFNKTVKKRRSPAEIKQLIFDLLSKEGSLSKAELIKKMGYTKLTDAVSKAIGELLAEQKIKYTEIKTALQMCFHSRSQARTALLR